MIQEAWSKARARDPRALGPLVLIGLNITPVSTLLQAIQKGNMEGAKIHAENSIRQKNQALNYRRMSARIDAVSARVQTALTMKQVWYTIKHLYLAGILSLNTLFAMPKKLCSL